jgi:hypothetical protein
VHWYQGKRPDIKIYGALFPLPPAVAEQSGLGISVGTNSNGMRAWILPPAELATFKQRANFSSSNTLTITARDGQQSRMSIGALPIQPTPTNALVVGMNMVLIPRKLAGAVQLRTEANFFQMAVEIAPTTNRTSNWTNFVGSRAMIPDNGGLIIQTGNWGESGQTNQWFLLLSPQPVSPPK